MSPEHSDPDAMHPSASDSSSASSAKGSPDGWTIGRMLDWMTGYLGSHGDDNPRASTMWLVSDATGLTRTQLYLDLERPLAKEELDSLRTNVRRRADGEPLQYITGKTFFRHIEVAVREGVLIPRPETEVLVSEVLAAIPAWKRPTAADSAIRDEDEEDPEAEEDEQPPEPIRIAEIGSGSGCIACSLAYEHPLVEVHCTDISMDAVELTNLNAQRTGVSDRVHVIECDLGEGIEGPFEVIVSNPPYIPTAVLATMPDEVVSFEPGLALDGGEDGLDIFRRIAEWGIGELAEGGLLACELHEDSLGQARSIAHALGYEDVRIVRDLAGKDRVLLATFVG